MSLKSIFNKKNLIYSSFGKLCSINNRTKFISPSAPRKYKFSFQHRCFPLEILKIYCWNIRLLLSRDEFQSKVLILQQYINNISFPMKKNGSSVIRIIHMQMITIYFNSSWFEFIFHVGSGRMLIARSRSQRPKWTVRWMVWHPWTQCKQFIHPRNYEQLK